MSAKLLGIGSRIKHPELGLGVVIGIKINSYSVSFIKYGISEVAHLEEMDIIEEVTTPQDMLSFQMVATTLTDILTQWNGIGEVVKLGDKWNGGKLLLQPADTNLKPKEIPIETFFHKIVMLRDRLRVMEQRINSSKNLNDEEKVNLQQYLTRIYGSLTTFNVLFKSKNDYFKGAKK